MHLRYLYLLLDLLAVSVPLAFSFYAKANFSKTWKYLFPGIILTAALFIVWDIYFTRWGVWGFNPQYLTGLTLLHLPLEEWLFFFCIPYACVFTYFSLAHLVQKDYLGKYAKAITWILIIGLAVIGLWHVERWYTSVTFIAVSIFLLLHVYVFKSAYLSKFYFTFVFLLIPFFVINGILTGTGIEGEVVWYNDLRNLGIRIGTIPVEDTFYGMLLILMNITLYEVLQNRICNSQYLNIPSTHTL